MIAANKLLLLQVKELVERCGNSAVEIANKLGTDVETARQLIDLVISTWS